MLNFPKTAQLLWKEVLSTNVVVVNGLGTNTQVIVRKRVSGKNVDTDVSSFFSRSTTLSVGVTNATGVVKRQVGSFAMTNSKLAFSLASFTTQTDASVLAGRPKATKEAYCIVTGAGQSSGTPMAFSGTIQTSGGKLE